jgi:MFS family permease
MQKITILSLSLLTILGTPVIAAALSEIAASFPNSSTTQIKLLLTVPSLAIFFIASLTGYLSRLLGDKNYLLIGLTAYIVGGFGGSFAIDYNSLLISRIVFGIGLGILMPMTTGLIGQFYSGKTRLEMMGWSQSVNNLAGILSSIAAGFLAAYSWRYAFSIFLIALPSMALVFYHIPRHKVSSTSAIPHVRLPVSTWLWAVAVFFQMLSVFAVPVNLALFIDEQGIGGASQTGLGLAAMTMAGLVSGLLSVRAKLLFGNYLIPSMLLLEAAGYFLLVQSESLTPVVIALFTVGFGNGFILPYLLFCSTNSVDKSRAVAAMGLAIMAVSLGQFATPVILDNAIKLAHAHSTASIFLLLAVVISLASLALFFVTLFKRQAALE